MVLVSFIYWSLKEVCWMFVLKQEGFYSLTKMSVFVGILSTVLSDMEKDNLSLSVAKQTDFDGCG